MTNYYGVFIPGMHRLRAPLDALLKKDTPFVWSSECQDAFQRDKDVLTSPLLLTHYDPKLELIVATDASDYGIGAVILHRYPDGSEKAIYHASRSLTGTEKKYGQIEKEGLALVYAVRKFHSWSLLRCYDFKIEYRKITEFGQTDALSRLIAGESTSSEDTVIAQAIQDVEANVRDEILKNIMEYVQKDRWPPKSSPNITPYQALRRSLSLQHDCLFFGPRIVIPLQLRHQVLKLPHDGHPGATRMKMLTRSYRLVDQHHKRN
ncbi:hypothetical protein ANCDUO_00739 [Ancylostoma duodenale]|uniref:RNA-directed DNA polymerase n=1 Tax=Ancylostoma duodenale TaxID=51022 RepID=A0A0C2HH13_9BILA|nr:hypothetical protein ANCDUO_00739 [Ancylostoma duodenale]